MPRLFLLFTIVPLLELFLLLQIGRLVGFWPTVLGVIVTAALGAHLAQREGLKTFQRWRGALAAGRLPEEGLLGSLLVLVGGVLLVAPGVLTDVVGLLLLVPATRRIAAGLVRRELERRIRSGAIRVVSYRGAQDQRRASDRVIESRPIDPDRD
ncbi:FxsA family protein [Vulgatibacter sp.]|uniref:FxsA family protein n=1 Tax=Vulgatibacter sp. TaxID=1971226 RepID=UPI00356858C4